MMKASEPLPFTQSNFCSGSYSIASWSCTGEGARVLLHTTSNPHSSNAAPYISIARARSTRSTPSFDAHVHNKSILQVETYELPAIARFYPVKPSQNALLHDRPDFSAKIAQPHAFSIAASSLWPLPFSMAITSAPDILGGTERGRGIVGRRGSSVAVCGPSADRLRAVCQPSLFCAQPRAWRHGAWRR